MKTTNDSHVLPSAWILALSLSLGAVAATSPSLAVAAEATAVPADGMAIKGSGAAIYLMHSGKKRWIPSWQTMLNLGTGGNVITLTDAQLAAIPTGPQVPENAERLPVKGSSAWVYYLEAGKKREVASWSDFLALGFQGADIVTLPDTNIAAIPVGVAIAALPPEGVAVKGSGATIYLMHAGKKREIPSWQAMLNLGTGGRFVVATDVQLGAIPTGTPLPENAERLPIKGASATMYLLEAGKKREIASWPDFLALGLKGADILNLPDVNIAAIPTGTAIAALPPEGVAVKGSGAATYLMHAGRKRSIPSWQALVNLGTGGRCVTATDAQLSAIPTGTPLPENAERLPVKGTTATIYLLEAGKKRKFASWSDFLALGFQGADIVNLPDANIAVIPDGAAIVPQP